MLKNKLSRAGGGGWWWVGGLGWVAGLKENKANSVFKLGLTGSLAKTDKANIIYLLEGTSLK
jgi:hypothetical protein